MQLGVIEWGSGRRGTSLCDESTLTLPLTPYLMTTKSNS